MADEVKPKKKMTKKQLDNLVPFSQMRSEDAEKIRRKAAAKTNELRRQRRTLAEDIRIIFSKPMREGKSTDLSELDFIDKDALENANLTIQQKILIKMANESMKGNVRAYDTLIKQIGESGVDRLELSGEVTVKGDPKKLEKLIKRIEKNPELKKDLFDE